MPPGFSEALESICRGMRNDDAQFPFLIAAWSKGNLAKAEENQMNLMYTKQTQINGKLKPRAVNVVVFIELFPFAVMGLLVVTSMADRDRNRENKHLNWGFRFLYYNDVP